jgi:hypothetical protein
MEIERDWGAAGKSPARPEFRGRQNSLRHVKDSTEVLRQRSTKRAGKDAVSDANAATREGRHFTVANVGNNGKIYLRCVVTAPVQRLGRARPSGAQMDRMRSLICDSGSDQQSGRPTRSLRRHRSRSPRPPRGRVIRSRRTAKARRTSNYGMANGRIRNIRGRPHAVGGGTRPTGGTGDRHLDPP